MIALTALLNIFGGRGERGDLSAFATDHQWDERKDLLGGGVWNMLGGVLSVGNLFLDNGLNLHGNIGLW